MNFKKLTLLLALLVMTLSADAALGDKIKKIKCGKDITLTGVVCCGDEPVAGVAVTDGVNIVRTDADGIYRLASQKKYGLVYLSVPAGYEPLGKGIVPDFWAATTLAPKKRERHDFELKKVDDSRVSMIMCADTHLCNSDRGDLQFFAQNHIPAVRRVYDEVNDAPVYTVILGDITWDRFWTMTGFSIDNVTPYLTENNYPTQVYTIMGNHDNDPSVPAGENTDLLATARYRNVFGPTFYSMDKGGFHFVMLDNIVYKNEFNPKEKLKPGVVGSRNYDVYVDEAQIDWLRKDLAAVAKSTPIVVCMHSPLRRIA
ncbi:MAG: metallophosphoesterase N-terminal domain-containing protein, partial [Alistipes sp.]